MQFVLKKQLVKILGLIPNNYEIRESFESTLNDQNSKYKSRIMCTIRNVFIIFIIFSATKVISEPIIVCEPKLSLSWTYNHETNTSNYMEIKTNLENVSLKFDFGFLKLTKRANENYILFRQAAIRRDGDEDHNITLRYEDGNKKKIGKKEIIVADPMCQMGKHARLNIIEFDDISLTNTAYSCNCLSSVHDNINFIR